MTGPMTSETDQRLLELVAITVGFEHLMYVPASFPHRSGLLYKHEHAHMSVWDPLVDDGNLFRLAVAIPAVNLQEIIKPVYPSTQVRLGFRFAVVRKVFVRAIATMVIDSCSSDSSSFVQSDIAVEEDEQ